MVTRNTHIRPSIYHSIKTTLAQQNIGEQNWTGEYVKYKVSAYDEDNNANGIIGKSYKLNEDGSGYIETEVEADTIVVGNGNEKASAITLKQDSIIRFVYEEISHNQEEEIAYFPVTFYDHNLTDGGADEAANQGLNRQEFFKSSTNTSLANKPKIGVGQTSSGNTSDWAENYNWKSGALTEELRKIEEKTEQKQEYISGSQKKSNGRPMRSETEKKNQEDQTEQLT